MAIVMSLLGSPLHRIFWMFPRLVELWADVERNIVRTKRVGGVPEYNGTGIQRTSYYFKIDLTFVWF